VFSDEKQWWHEMLDSGWQPHLTKTNGVGGYLKELKKKAFKELHSHKRPDGIPLTTSTLLAFGRKSSCQ
jgi:hypothetical protein